MGYIAPRVTGEEIKDAVISITGSGQQVVVAAVPGKKIRVVSFWIIVDAATAVTWQNGTTDITGAAPLAINGGWVVDFSPVGHFETAVGAALNIELGTSSANAKGSVNYFEYD